MPRQLKVHRKAAGATRLFLLRAERSLRQRDLSELTGLNKNRICYIETGRAWPKEHEIEALAKVYELPFAEICELAREARQAARAEGASV